MGNVYELRPNGEPTPDPQRLPDPCGLPDPRKAPLTTFSVPAGVDPVGYTIDLEQYDQRPLIIAEKEHFFEMCKSSLWGSEQTPGSDAWNEFGELLRSLVMSYQPATRDQLELLAIIADQMWKLKRIRGIQQGVYSAQAEARGKDGISLKVLRAMAYEPVLQDYQNALDKAIAMYQRSTR